jgi:hypothetical protein
MKKLITLLLATSTLIVSCQKSSNVNPNESASTLEKVKQLDFKYNKKYPEIKSRSWKQYAAADAVGGLTNAGWGASVAGPWGAICGGIAGGIYCSAMLDYFSLVAPSRPYPIDDNGQKISGLNISSSEPGNMHNTSLHYLLSNRADFTISENNYDETKVKDYCVKVTADKYKFSVDDLNKIMSNVLTDDEIKQYSENPDMYFEKMGKTQLRYICEDFFNKAFSLDDPKTLQSYTYDFMQTINDAKDLKDDEKAEIITYASISTASLLYHYF